MTLNDGGFLNAVRDGSCTYVLNLLDNGGIDLEQQDQVKKLLIIWLHWFTIINSTVAPNCNRVIIRMPINELNF